jgi:hypothetical protein
MKALLLSTLLFAGINASAAAVSVNSNVYTASGAGSKNYTANLNKIAVPFAKVSQSELGTLTFAGAQVDVATKAIKYTFQKIEVSTNVKTCWSELSFVTQESEAGPVVSDVTAKVDCYDNKD